MKQTGINCVFHYFPLHAAPQGQRAACADRELPVTTDLADQLVRLPLRLGLEEGGQERVINTLIQAISQR